MKRRSSQSKNIFFIIFGLIFFCVGLGVFIGGIAFLSSTKKFIARADVVEGEITDIKVSYDSDNDVHHYVYVRYVYDGNEYNTQLSEYSSSMHIGKNISLYVDPRNPYSVRSKGMSYMVSIIMMSMGAVFMAVGLPFMLTGLLKKWKRNRLMQNGTCVYATIIGSDIDRTYSVNGSHPFYVDCEYQNPYDGMKYLYRSGHIWEDPYQYTGSQVPVYVDRQNPAKYYVAVETLESAANPMIRDYR